MLCCVLCCDLWSACCRICNVCFVLGVLVMCVVASCLVCGGGCLWCVGSSSLCCAWFVQCGVCYCVVCVVFCGLRRMLYNRL